VNSFFSGLGLSGVFLEGASIQNADGATDPFREFYVDGIPEGMVFDGACLWAADFHSNTVIKLEPDDGTFFGAFPTMAAGSQYLAFDGENIWLTQA
jgi:hypothetical protein